MAIETVDLGRGDKRVGQFAIEKELGRDGAGVVYQAFDDRTRRKVSLRLLPDAVRADPARRERVIADVRAAMAIEHPALASIVDVGEAPEGMFVASELAEGRSLRERLDADGKLDLASALRIASEVASAIAALHRAGRAHGALDAGRVILDDAGRVKVVAFGLAEVTGYPDALADVSAIGTLLREMIDWRGAPTAIDDLVRHATDPDPAKRPANADALLSELARVDLPTTPVGDSVVENRQDVTAGASRTWIVGASVVLALVIAVAIAAMFAMTQQGGG